MFLGLLGQSGAMSRAWSSDGGNRKSVTIFGTKTP
jgi:hypothetical protein